MRVRMRIVGHWRGGTSGSLIPKPIKLVRSGLARLFRRAVLPEEVGEMASLMELVRWCCLPDQDCFFTVRHVAARSPGPERWEATPSVGWQEVRRLPREAPRKGPVAFTGKGAAV